jgi:hypothetical protein
MNKTEELKSLIVERFGSVRAFAFHEGQKIPSWTVIRTLRGEKKRNSEGLLQSIEDQIHKLKPSRMKITEGQRELIRRTIAVNFKTSTDFCSIHSEFSRTFVSDVIRGKRSVFDLRMKRLFNLILTIHSSKNED